MNTCKPLFLDLSINKPRIVYLNVYQTFLFSAIKFHCHVQALPTRRRVSANPAFFLGGYANTMFCAYLPSRCD